MQNYMKISMYLIYNNTNKKTNPQLFKYNITITHTIDDGREDNNYNHQHIIILKAVSKLTLIVVLLVFRKLT